MISEPPSPPSPPSHQVEISQPEAMAIVRILKAVGAGKPYTPNDGFVRDVILLRVILPHVPLEEMTACINAVNATYGRMV